MSLFTIAYRSIQQRGVASALTIFSMALGVMLVVAVLSIHGVVSQSFHNNSSLGYNMIVGPKGGKEQLVLNTVYYLSAPVENIPYTFYLEFLNRAERDKLLAESFDAKATGAVRESLELLALTDSSGVAGLVQPLAAGRAAEALVPDVQEAKAPPAEFGRNGKYGQFTELAIPVCLGDYFDRFRVVGTTPTLFNELVYDIENNRKFEFAQGRNFEWKSKENGFFEAVVGATVAREKNVKLGDGINPAHGEPGGHVHARQFIVVGILAPSGTPNDRAVFVNMEGFYLMEDHAKPLDEKALGEEEVQDSKDMTEAEWKAWQIAKAKLLKEQQQAKDPEPLPVEQREVTAILLRVHALGDATGFEIMRAMIAQARAKLDADIWPNTFTIDLLTHEGRCRGALVWNWPHHGRTFIWAKQTILCTGGAGQVYRETTNPEVATGDGLAIAYRAGAELRDMEFMQFHPTVLYIAGGSRSLITEAMRGEGAWLVDSSGRRFMPDYDERAELAPRDVVSRSIVAQMEKTRQPSVFLDLSHLNAEHVRKRFPGIARTCAEFGIDIATDPIPVRPGAHYMIGGVTVDHDGRTTLPGLWAAGEVTSSGLHGANRLASNSLLEGLVYGAHAGAGASAAALGEGDSYRAIPLENAATEQHVEPLDLVDIRNSLRSLMWRSAGVKSAGPQLAEAAETIRRWCRYVLSRQLSDPAGWELQNMLTVASLMVESDLAREESRGVHLRSDFPERDDDHWRRHEYFARRVAATSFG